MVRFFWGPFLFIFCLKGYLFICLIYCCNTGFIFKVSSKFVSRKKFCKLEDSWFLLYLFEVGIKLRFLFRSLYVSKGCSGCSSLFSVCLDCSWFCCNNLIWFLRSSISLSLSVDVWFVVEETLVGDVVHELDVVITTFSRELVVLLGCLACLFFSNVELLDHCGWCLP